MTVAQRARVGAWAVVALSAALMCSAAGIEVFVAGQLNISIAPQWWVQTAQVTERSGDSFTAAALVLLVAAMLAGAPSLRRAVLSLRRKVVGIDLFAVLGAIGAVCFGDFWLAAIFTFLAAAAHALEPIISPRIKARLAPHMPARRRGAASADVANQQPEITIYCCGMGMLADSLTPEQPHRVPTRLAIRID